MNVKQAGQWMRDEVQKIKAIPPPKRWSYIWEYYKLWIIAILTGVLLLFWGIHHYATTNAENWFFACFANTQADLGDGSEFWSDYAAYAGYDLDEKNLLFHAQCYFDPTGNTFGNGYYQMLIAYMDSGDLDVLVMEKDRLQAFGSSGRLMNLEDERMQTVFERYGDRLVYCEPQKDHNDSTLVPIGIDLSGTVLTGENGAYGNDAVLGVNALAPHLDQIEVFLAYLFENES